MTPNKLPAVEINLIQMFIRICYFCSREKAYRQYRQYNIMSLVEQGDLTPEPNDYHVILRVV